MWNESRERSEGGQGPPVKKTGKESGKILSKTKKGNFSSPAVTVKGRPIHPVTYRPKAVSPMFRPAVHFRDTKSPKSIIVAALAPCILEDGQGRRTAQQLPTVVKNPQPDLLAPFFEK
jgi:hypothetical protein